MAKLFSKQQRKKLIAWALPPLLIGFVKVLYWTCKKRFYFQTNGSSTPSIYAMWHGEILMLSFAYLHYTRRKNIDAIISQHADGDIVARFLTLQGGGVLRGSSSRGGREVFQMALQSLKSGRDIAITPDGPRGPRHSVAHGVASLALHTKAPIITMNYKASSFWTLKSWDAFCIPKPFSTLEFYFGDPFYVHELTTDEAIALVRERLLVHAQA